MLIYYNGTILHIKFDLFNTLGFHHISKKIDYEYNKENPRQFDLSCQGIFTQFLDGNAQNGKHYGHLHIPFE